MKICFRGRAVIFLSIFLFTSRLVAVQTTDRTPRVLVLIIASDDQPVYVALQNIWRSYMHLDKNHIQAFFIKGNPFLKNQVVFENDIIWSRTKEEIIPGIINKTILSLEAMLPELDKFDYVLRTNLSSFYVFPRLLEFLKMCPKTNFYAGSDIGGGKIASGCGFVISIDLAKKLLRDKRYLLNNTSGYDDAVLGSRLTALGAKLQRHKRMDFFSLSDWLNRDIAAMNSVFQFRVKGHEKLRLTNDVGIHVELRKIFY